MSTLENTQSPEERGRRGGVLSGGDEQDDGFRFIS